jgi:hypothetical protein
LDAKTTEERRLDLSSFRACSKASPAGNLEKVSAQAEAGRRLAIYDRQTGLLAYWYIRHRFEEEAARAATGAAARSSCCA